MAWIGSFMDCWLRMQAHTPLQGSANLAIIKPEWSSHYELHYKTDLDNWAKNNKEKNFRVVVCASSHEMRMLLRAAQFNLFEGKEDAGSKKTAQTGE